MNQNIIPSVRAAQLVLPCSDLSASIQFLSSQLGFKVRMIMPSEAPAVAVLSAHGCTVRLELTDKVDAPNPRLRLLCDLSLLPTGTPPLLQGPDGLQVELVNATPPVHVPEGTQEFVLTRLAGPESWGVGRAGMLYRDLIPSRLGGLFVASHILIPQGGLVPDYVHYHRVRFQMIFCKKGWVRLVYEDQGEPFILNAGDCVLQPPEIRHRVLEASAGMEVVEVGCPALHETLGDPDMPLPTGADLPERLYGSADVQRQKFVRHIAATAAWQPSRLAGFEYRDTGIEWATDGLAGARVLRPASGTPSQPVDRLRVGSAGAHRGEFAFFFVLAGHTTLQSQALGDHALNPGDSCVLPNGADYAFSPGSGLELLEVTLPAVLPGA